MLCSVCESKSNVVSLVPGVRFRMHHGRGRTTSAKLSAETGGMRMKLGDPTDPTEGFCKAVGLVLLVRGS